MSEPSDHLDPKEATEARLCAYLEGTLLPTEKVEIERHLLANPQHKRLLAELATTREWTRMLPFENVPIDLAEAFQGQVERSILLDDSDAQGATVRRWPQLVLIAATVVITLGLGFLIYAMLPGRGLEPLAYKYPPATGGTDSKVLSTPSPGIAPVTPTTQPMLSMAVPGRVVAAGSPAPSGGRREQLGRAAVARLPARTVILTISTDKPEDVLRQTRLFFQSNKVTADVVRSKSADTVTASATSQARQYNQSDAANYAQQQNVAPPAKEVDEDVRVRQINPSMVAALKAALAEGTSHATVIESTEPAEVESIAKGQSLTVTVPELVGPGIEKINVVKVAEDGTVTLPMIDPVPAEGLSGAALGALIAERYKQANLIPQANVTVAATTQPAAINPAEETRPVDLIVRVRATGP